MRIIVLLSFLFVAGLLLSCESNRQQKELSSKMEAFKAVYAPDTRTDRFDVAIKKEKEGFVLGGSTTSIAAFDALEKYLDSIDIPVTNRVITLPDSTVGQEHWGLVHVSVCNIRSEPRHSAELATQEVMGTELEILSREGGWFLIRTPNRYLGWLDEGGMIRITHNELEQWKSKPKRHLMQATGWIYSEPDPTSMVICDIVGGAVVIDLGQDENGFLHVELPDGRRGYALDLSSLAPSSAMGSDFVQTAVRFIGVPYLWGGTSTKGFDCSGYTKTVFALHGFLLPRDASQQVLVGQSIETDKTWKNLSPGDLLFFGSHREDGSERVTHVAIYMGDDKIIHATGQVKIESLNPKDPDFAKNRYDTFLQARRMVDAGRPRQGVLPMEW